MLINETLKKIHRKYSKDTDYPEGADNEDLLVRLDFVDDAISEYEGCIDEGYCWPELITKKDFIFNGTGVDALPENFLSFIKSFDDDGSVKASFLIGNTLYEEANPSNGTELEQQGATSSNVFWQEGENIRTLPAITGTYNLPCLEKHPRYTTGVESIPIKMRDPKFIEFYVAAKLFEEDEDGDQYETNMVSANEILKKMKYKSVE